MFKSIVVSLDLDVFGDRTLPVAREIGPHSIRVLFDGRAIASSLEVHEDAPT